MVGMPGLEPGNPEGADLQSAAVAAVPHPHSVFKPPARGCPLQAKENIRPYKNLVNLFHPAGRIYTMNPSQRDALHHVTVAARCPGRALVPVPNARPRALVPVPNARGSIFYASLLRTIPPATRARPRPATKGLYGHVSSPVSGSLLAVFAAVDPVGFAVVLLAL